MLNRVQYFLIGWAVSVFTGIGLVTAYGKEELHLMMNDWNSPWADVFFRWATYVGGGVFAAGVSVLLLFVRLRDALIVSTAWIGAGLTTQLLKRTVFSDSVRPGGVIDQNMLHIPEGVELNIHHSFPSGHSTTVFALCCSLALLGKNRAVDVFLIVTALVIAYSRVYLSQHFLVDIITGSFIGVIWAFFGYVIWQRGKKKWLEKSLIGS